MNLKMRPIKEAPLNERLLVIQASGVHVAISPPDNRTLSHWIGLPGVCGFYLIDDLLRAAETLDKITPEEGYEYTGFDALRYDGCDKEGNEISSVRVFFRRIQPPVEYRYETDGQLRQPHGDEYCWSEVDKRFYSPHPASNAAVPRLCYTRREVKR